MSSIESVINVPKESKVFCSICFDYIESNMSSLDSCSHNYHYNCIKLWSSLNNSCPLCKKRFNQITQPNKRVVKVKNVNKHYGSVDMSQFITETLCRTCGDGHDEDKLLLCDECDGGFHTYCLEPILTEIPSGNWYCSPCETERKRKEKARRKRRESNRGSRASRPRRGSRRSGRSQRPSSRRAARSVYVHEIFDPMPSPPLLTFSPPASANMPRGQVLDLTSYSSAPRIRPVENSSRGGRSLSTVQREQANINHLRALCRLQNNRLSRLFASRRGLPERLPSVAPLAMPPNGGDTLTVQQRARAYRNYLNAVELRVRKALRNNSFGRGG